MTTENAGQAQTMALQGLVNKLNVGLMKVPLISRGIGKFLVTLYVVGRKSGRRYTVPVAYTRHDGTLLIGSPFGWVRNLRTGEPVEILLQGKRGLADVEVISDEPGVLKYYGIICRDNRNFAKFNNIGFTSDGEPNPDHLHQAYVHGARAVVLTPR